MFPLSLIVVQTLSNPLTIMMTPGRFPTRLTRPLPACRTDLVGRLIVLIAEGMSRSRSSAYHSERVIVLGAGMSGLACARELQNRGYEVLVVEARGRVGGRLKGGSVNLANRQEPQETAEDHGGRGKHKAQQMEQPTQQQQHLVDLGGALIHGVDDNPLSRLVQDMGITTQPVQECLLFQNGWPIDPRDDARISTVFNDCLEESFQRCQDRVDDGSSFGVVFQQVCRERSVNSSNPVFLWHKANLEVSCGASLEDLGWRWNEDEQYGYDGDHVAVRQSWKAVVDGLAEGLDILYDAPVSRVHVVHPAPVKAPSPKPEPHSSTAPSAGPIPSTSALKATSSSKQGSASKRRRGAILDFSAAAVAVSARKSRRLLNLDADARRSSRANLGKEVERYKAEPSSSSPRRKRAVGAKPEPLLLRPKKHTVVQVTLQSGRVLESDFVGEHVRRVASWFVVFVPLTAFMNSHLVAYQFAHCHLRSYKRTRLDSIHRSRPESSKRSTDSGRAS
jgi:Flavin containing amine oxidoreductase